MKDHAKQTKKMRAVVKKKSQAVDKLAKKARKKAGDAELAEEHEIKVGATLEMSRNFHNFHLLGESAF